MIGQSFKGSIELSIYCLHLQEKMFATKNNVTRLLNSLDSDTVTKKDNVTQLEVTCMADDKLTILVKVRIFGHLCYYQWYHMIVNNDCYHNC